MQVKNSLKYGGGKFSAEMLLRPPQRAFRLDPFRQTPCVITPLSAVAQGLRSSDGVSDEAISALCGEDQVQHVLTMFAYGKLVCIHDSRQGTGECQASITAKASVQSLSSVSPAIRCGNTVIVAIAGLSNGELHSVQVLIDSIFCDESASTDSLNSSDRDGSHSNSEKSSGASLPTFEASMQVICSAFGTHSDSVTCICAEASDDGNLWAGSSAGTVACFSSYRNTLGKCVGSSPASLDTSSIGCKLLLMDSPVTCIASSPNRRMVAIACQGRGIFLFDSLDRQQVMHVHPFFGDALSCTWSPRSAWLLVGGQDDCVSVWDVRTRSLIARLESHRGWVTSVATIGIQTSSSASVSEISQLTQSVQEALESHDDHVDEGLRILSGGGDGRIGVWRIAMTEIAPSRSRTTSSARPPSPGKATVTDQEWEAAPVIEALSCPLVHREPLSALAVGGHFIASSCTGGFVRVWGWGPAVSNTSVRKESTDPSTMSAADPIESKHNSADPYTQSSPEASSYTQNVDEEDNVSFSKIDVQPLSDAQFMH